MSRIFDCLACFFEDNFQFFRCSVNFVVSIFQMKNPTLWKNLKNIIQHNNQHLEQLCDIQFKKTNNRARINVWGSSHTKYFSINFNQHKNLFYFFNENIVSEFLKTVHEVFQPNGIKRYKLYGHVEISILLLLKKLIRYILQVTIIQKVLVGIQKLKLYTRWLEK